MSRDGVISHRVLPQLQPVFGDPSGVALEVKETTDGVEGTKDRRQDRVLQPPQREHDQEQRQQLQRVLVPPLLATILDLSGCGKHLCRG